MSDSQIVIADTSCFILLDKIDELDLLRKVFGTIRTTHEIASEFGLLLPDWVEIVTAEDKEMQQTLEKSLDKGESSALALALENENSLVIIDERKGREVAKSLSIRYTGTLGIIIQAKLENKISSGKAIVEKIQATNFRISPPVLNMVLEKLGE